MKPEPLSKHDYALQSTLRAMVPAVGTALIVTILGFVALFLSPVPMVADFGKMLAIGVSVSFAAAIFLLVPILYIRDRFSQNEGKAKTAGPPDLLQRILEANTKAVLRAGAVIILIALVATVLGLWADGQVGVQTDVETFMPQNSGALQDVHALRDVLGSTDQVVLLLRGDDLLSPRAVSWIDQITEGARKEFPQGVTAAQSVTSIMRSANEGKLFADEREARDFVSSLPPEQRKLFIHDDYKDAIVQLNIRHLEVSEADRFLTDLRSYVAHPPEGVTVSVTGKSVVDVAMISALTSGRHEMTLAGIALVFVGLLVLYRHPIKALIPIFPIALIIGWSGGTMYLLNMSYTPLTATMGALIIGIGTEFTVLLLERYCEERRLGFPEREAMLVATRQIGKAIVASGLTVVGGFSALLVSNFVILRDFGFLTLVNMAFSLITTLVILPPTIVLMDRLFKFSKNNSKVPRSVQIESSASTE